MPPQYKSRVEVLTSQELDNAIFKQNDKEIEENDAKFYCAAIVFNKKVTNGKTEYSYDIRFK